MEPTVTTDITAERVLERLRLAGRPLLKSEFGIPGTDPEGTLKLNVLLDQMQTDDKIVRRTIGPRVCYHLPGGSAATAKPAPVVHDAPAPATPAAVVKAGPDHRIADVTPAAAPPVSERGKRRDLVRDPAGLAIGSTEERVYECLRRDGPARWHYLAKVLKLGEHQVKNRLKVLHKKGRVQLTRKGPRHTVWSAVPIGIGSSARPTSAPPPGEPYAPGGHARCTLETIGDLEQKIGFHEQAAEREAATRAAQQAEAIHVEANGVTSAEMAALTTPHFVTGLKVAAADPSPLRCVLYSDGELVIERGDDLLRLSTAETRQLIDYLDRVCAIDHR